MYLSIVYSVVMVMVIKPHDRQKIFCENPHRINKWKISILVYKLRCVPYSAAARKTNKIKSTNQIYYILGVKDWKWILAPVICSAVLNNKSG